MTDSGIANRLFFSGLIILITASFFTILLIAPAFGEEKREAHIAQIYTRWLDNSFKHVYAICSSELLEGDIILISSDVAMNSIKIERDTEISDCGTYEVRIMAMNPSSVTTQILKIEDKEKTMQILEKKVVTLENLINRLFSERDELLKEAETNENNFSILEAANQKLIRIADLMSYQQKTIKKLELISTI